MTKLKSKCLLILSFIFSLSFLSLSLVRQNTSVYAMQLYIEVSIVDVSGKLCLEVEPSDTIESIKGEIQDRKGVLPEKLTLLYKDNVLEDNRTLADYNIQKEATIYAYYKVDIDEEYNWNSGEDFVYGDEILEIAPKVFDAGEEIAVENISFIYYESMLLDGWELLDEKPKNVGEYKVVVSVDNYYGRKEFLFNINKRALNVTIDDKASVYGEDLVELTASCDNLAYDDKLSDICRLETEATSSSPLGKYFIWGTDNNGIIARNYDITFIGSYVEIYDIKGVPTEFNSGMSIYSINNKAKDIVIVDEENKTLLDSKVEIIDAKYGVDSEAVFMVKVVNMENIDDVSKAKQVLEKQNKINQNEKIYGIYDAKLLVDNIEVQPSGTLKIKMQVPLELVGREFSLYNLHKVNNDIEIIELSFTDVDENGCITFETSKLSQFVFIGENLNNGSLDVYVIVLIGVGSFLIFLILLYLIGYFFLYRNGKLDGKKIKSIYKFLPKGNE